MDDTDDAAVTDQALDRQLNAAFEIEPSPEFMARIRTRVATEPMRPGWQIGWSPVVWSGGGLSVVAAAVFVALLWARSGDVTHSPVGRATDTPAVAEVVATRPEAPASGGMTGSASAKGPRRVRTVSRRLRPTVSPDAERSVVIAADEAAALRDLFANLRGGRMTASMLPDLSAVPAALAPIEVIEVPPIAMNPLTPIEALGAL